MDPKVPHSGNSSPQRWVQVPEAAGGGVGGRGAGASQSARIVRCPNPSSPTRGEASLPRWTCSGQLGRSLWFLATGKEGQGPRRPPRMSEVDDLLPQQLAEGGAAREEGRVRSVPSLSLQRGQGAPAREPIISSEEQKQLMLYYHRRQEELKVPGPRAVLGAGARQSPHAAPRGPGQSSGIGGLSRASEPGGLPVLGAGVMGPLFSPCRTAAPEMPSWGTLSLQRLEEDEDDACLNSPWADSGALKRHFHGVKDIKWRPR